MSAFKPRLALSRGGGGLSGMTPNPSSNPDRVRVAGSPALGAGGGGSGTAPVKSLEELAYEIVYKTPSEFDSILIVTPSSGISYASEGQYGGWIVKGKLSSSEDAIALWCYEQEQKVVMDARTLDNEVVKRFMEELAKHGFNFDYAVNVPKARVIRYKYRPVDITVTKATDRYTVIDVTPAGGDVIEAEATHIYWPYHISRKGHCSGFCSETSREKIILVAKMLGLEAYRAEAGGRDYEVRVKIVTDYSQVAGYLRSKFLAPEPAETTSATAEAGLPPLPELPGEAPEVEVGGGEAVQATTPPGYVKARIVSFDLPTEYLGGRTRTGLEEEGEGEEKRTIMVERKEVRIPQLRSIRRKFYKTLNRIAFKASGMWILMHDVKPEELEELNNAMKEVSEVLARHGIPMSRSVELVDAYLPEKWVKMKLAEYIEEVTTELEAKRRIEKKTREVLREIKRLEELLKRLIGEQKFYGGTLQEGEVA
jgi:antitoxin component of RelBE/YafQ-DinJ toxin-antitoxin module